MVKDDHDQVPDVMLKKIGVWADTLSALYVDMGVAIREKNMNKLAKYTATLSNVALDMISVTSLESCVKTNCEVDHEK